VASMFNIKLIRWLSSFISIRLSLKHSNYLLHRKFNWLARLIVCFLCLNVILASTYHVICIELNSEGGISKVHFQMHHCFHPQDNESGKFIQSHNHKTSHAALLSSQSKAQSRPNCIDNHIQFTRKSFPSINLDAASLFKSIFPNIQRNIDQFQYAQINTYSLKECRSPLPSFSSSVIRSTVMLI